MESIAVPVSLTLQLHPEGADIGSLERAVNAGLDEVARRLWQTLLSAIEAARPVPHGHVGCGGIWKANGRAPRRVVTLAGEVGLSRRRCRCGACGGEVVPLDEALGLEPRTQHTLGVRERGPWLVTELSYAKTARALEELRGLSVSHGQLHRWVEMGAGRRHDGPRPLQRHPHGGRTRAGLSRVERIGRDRHRLLDWYHLSEQLRFGIGRAHEEVLSTSLGAAMPGDVEALLAILPSHARSLERGDPEQALRCRSVIGYIENKHRAIANYRIVPLASSGPMEKGVDITICRRFETGA